MEYIINSCKLMGQELGNRNQSMAFDIENGGGFLSLQTDKPLDHDDNIFIANKIASAIIPETDFYKNKIHPQAVEVLEFVKNSIQEHNIEPNKSSEYSVLRVRVDEVIEELLKHKYFNFIVENEIKSVNNDGDNLKPIYKETLEIKDPAFNRAGKKLFHEGCFTTEYIDKLFNIINEPIGTNFRNIDELTIIAQAFLYSVMLSETYAEFGKTSKKLAVKMKAIFEKYEDYLNTNVLILRLDIENDEKLLYILEETFVKLPESGEYIEALLGLALHPDINSDHSLCLLNNLVANKEEYERRWVSFESVSKYVDPYEKQKNYRSIIELGFLHQIEKMTEDVLKYVEHEGNKERIKIDIHNYLKNVTVKEDLDSLSDLIFDILGNVIFTKTNYSTFISECKEFLNKDSRLQMEDVIVLVNAKFITKYLLGKIKVFNIKE